MNDKTYDEEFRDMYGYVFHVKRCTGTDEEPDVAEDTGDYERPEDWDDYNFQTETDWKRSRW